MLLSFVMYGLKRSDILSILKSPPIKRCCYLLNLDYPQKKSKILFYKMMFFSAYLTLVKDRMAKYGKKIIKMCKKSHAYVVPQFIGGTTL